MRFGSYDYYILHIITFNSQSSTLIFSYLPISSFACENLSCLYSSAASPLNPSIRTFTLQMLRHSHDPLIRSRMQRAPRGHLLHLFLLSRLIRMLHDKPHFARCMPQISFQVRSGYINSVSLKCEARESKSNVARAFCMSFDSCGSKSLRIFCPLPILGMAGVFLVVIS